MNMLKGFRFGMLLQLAVGPVCIYILKTAISLGFLPAMEAVGGVVLADGLYILLAVAGVASLLEHRNLKKALRLFGAAVLALFGLDMVLGALGHGLFPAFTSSDAGSGFAGALVLTLSNPLTILFWSGVFSARVSAEGMARRAVAAFGAGALLSTVCFLAAVAALGQFSGQLLPQAVLTVLNILVGLLLLFFSIRMLYNSGNKRKSSVSVDGD